MAAARAGGALQPLREGMFVLGDRGDPVALSGSRCRRCGHVDFPERVVCPACGPGAAVDRYPLSTDGVVHASTVVHVASLVGHRPPYAYGYVDLPADDTRIFAPFSGANPERFAPGVAVRVAFGEIPASGMAGVLGYSFRLVSVEDSRD